LAFYKDRHARLYDLFYANKPYAQEAAFVAGLLQSLGAPARARVLELACGTGRHARELERLGHAIVATDNSTDMLACAREAAQEAGARVRFFEADMRQYDLPEKDFDAAVCLFDSIGYLQTNEAILSALAATRAHLKHGGLLVLEFWHAAAMLKAFDPVRVRRWPTADGEIVRVSETSLDHFNQVAHVAYDILEVGADGKTSRLRETHTNRYFLAQEMRALLEQGGFEVLRWCSGFSDAPIDENTWHIVLAARRRDP
jgi:SAM-dependent methyltransferase